MTTDKNGKELKVGQTVQYFDLSTTYVVEFIRDEMFGLRSNYRDLHGQSLSESYRLEIVNTPAPAETYYTEEDMKEAFQAGSAYGTSQHLSTSYTEFMDNLDSSKS